MGEPAFTNHYDVLQVSSRADHDTIQRVFRHLAKRYHPDNTESGDAGRFKQLVESFQVLSDPEARAKYDVGHGERVERAWRIFDQSTALNDVAADRRTRTALLSVLYTARRNDAAPAWASSSSSACSAAPRPTCGSTSGTSRRTA